MRGQEKKIQGAEHPRGRGRRGREREVGQGDERRKRQAQMGESSGLKMTLVTKTTANEMYWAHAPCQALRSAPPLIWSWRSSVK